MVFAIWFHAVKQNLPYQLGKHFNYFAFDEMIE